MRGKVVGISPGPDLVMRDPRVTVASSIATISQRLSSRDGIGYRCENRTTSQ
jgi:hypothetical protein